MGDYWKGSKNLVSTLTNDLELCKIIVDDPGLLRLCLLKIVYSKSIMYLEKQTINCLN